MTFDSAENPSWDLNDEEILSALENAIIILRRAELAVRTETRERSETEKAEIGNPKELAAECRLARTALCGAWQEMEERGND